MSEQQKHRTGRRSRRNERVTIENVEFLSESKQQNSSQPYLVPVYDGGLESNPTPASPYYASHYSSTRYGQQQHFAGNYAQSAAQRQAYAAAAQSFYFQFQQQHHPASPQHLKRKYPSKYWSSPPVSPAPNLNQTVLYSSGGRTSPVPTTTRDHPLKKKSQADHSEYDNLSPPVIWSDYHTKSGGTANQTQERTALLASINSGYGATRSRSPRGRTNSQELPPAPRPSTQRRTEQQNLLFSPSPQRISRHRRAKSDTPENRKNSAIKPQRRRLHTQGGVTNEDPTKRLDHHRSRSLTNIMHTDSSSVGSGTNNQNKRNHRRQDSFGSMTGLSVATEGSMMTHRSDIRQSSFFDGYNEVTGEVKLSFPLSHVHLQLVPPEEQRQDRDASLLKEGHLYYHTVDPQVYENYHHVADERAAKNNLFDEDILMEDGVLPRPHYTLCIRDDIYSRVLDEVCAATTTPCGLFYCGHHEDVSRPDISIAWAVLLLLFVAMALFAWW